MQCITQAFITSRPLKIYKCDQVTKKVFLLLIAPVAPPPNKITKFKPNMTTKVSSPEGWFL